MFVEPLERSEELALLEARFAEAARGSGRLVLVGGEAGVGKTLLVRRFCEDRAGSARVLWGAARRSSRRSRSARSST